MAILYLALAFLLVFTTTKVFHFEHKLKQVNNIPGARPLFGVLTPLAFLKTSTWWNPTTNFTWINRNKLYEKYNSEVISVIPTLWGRPNLYTRSMDAFDQALRPTRQVMNKPEAVKRVLRLCGDNLLSVDGDEWRRHRRIIGNALGSQTNELVWSETKRLYQEMVRVEGWEASGITRISNMNELCAKIALYVIASAGFGLRLSWHNPPSSSHMTLQEAFSIFVDTLQLRVILPSWVYRLPITRIKRIQEAYETISDIVSKTIQQQKMSNIYNSPSLPVKERRRKDILSRLLEANEGESGTKLSDSELQGSIFAMLFAGHETTANAITATIGLLAANPDEQDKAYNSVGYVDLDGSEPIDDSLEYIRACILEAIRLYPAGSVLNREAHVDMELNISREKKAFRNRSYLVTKGTTIMFDVVGHNYDPVYYPDPERFDPSRWLRGTSPEEKLKSDVSFSIGPRVCIGRKFALTEATCFIAQMIRNFRILPGNLLSGETLDEWRHRCMVARKRIILEVGNIPVVLERRG